MKRLLACSLVVLAGIVVLRSQSPVSVQIDAAASRHPIDPRVYGMSWADAAAMADLRVPINRAGGNATSRYNWQLNATNRAADGYFESIGSASAAPGGDADAFVSQAKALGAEPLLTIPMVGWVATLGPGRSPLASFSIGKYGPQSGADLQGLADAGNGVAATGQPIATNDPHDANVPADAAFQRGWLEHLVARSGPAAGGGVRYYGLDNEPGLWHATHRDVHPAGATMDEVLSRTIAYGAQIKAVDPDALLLGPEEWGWSGYFYSGYDLQWGQTNGWTGLPDRTAHGNQDYLPWYLDQLHQQERATGQRLLDIFSVHFYPQGGEDGTDTSAVMQRLRNRSTRTLWDPDYVNESWIGTPVQLVPRLHGWVAAYYPGTQVGLTEYNWGAEGHINGATAQADLLGIFGREQVDLATRWTTPDPSTPTYKAIKLYRNYDNRGSAFGDTSVAAVGSNPDTLAVFAAQRGGDGALTVMAVNKDFASVAVNLSVANFTAGGPVQAYQLTASNEITRLADRAVSSGTLAATLPAQSITLLVIPAASANPAERSLAAVSAPGLVSALAVVSIPGTIQAEDFDSGGEGVGYHDLDTANRGGVYRPNEGVDISPTTDTGGGYHVDWIRAGEWLKYSVNVAQSGSYTVAARMAPLGGAFHIDVDGVNVTPTIPVASTGGFQNVTATIALTAGNHSLRFVADTQGPTGFVGNLNYMTFSAATPPPAPAKPIPGTIQAEDFDTGGEGVGYHDLDTANRGAVYRLNEGVDISPTTDTGGGYHVDWIRAGEWLKYSVNVTQSGSYTFVARLAPLGGAFHIEVDGVNVSQTITVPTTGAFQNVTATMALTAGNHSLRFVADTQGPTGFVGNLNYMTFTASTPPSGGPASVSATAGTPQSAAVNTAFATALQAVVRNASSNPVSGVTVTFTAPASGASAKFGSALTATAVTNTSGIATAPTLTANGTTGSYTVSASVTGVATPAGFSLTNSSTPPPPPPPSGANCGMQKNDAALAFCEKFDQPFPVTNRSGQLDGTLWGVSRITGNNNFTGPVANAWSASTLVGCGGNQAAQPDGTDVIVCNGQMRESTDDNHNVTTLALYPKQPFDFANRTGTVAFDVTNDTSGMHGAWPEFWLSDQPVPAPFTHGGPPCDNCSAPRNGLGIRFGAVFEAFQGPQAPNCPADNNRRWIVDSFVIVRNYVVEERPLCCASGWETLGCAIASSGPNGGLNHIELRISQGQIEVWASDAGSTTLKLIARSVNANLTFTRGLIWLEDSHYNAEKSPIPSHKNHTFTWDNVAFDGPKPYRDLSFDVLDRLTTLADGTINLGWLSTSSSPANLTTLPMTAGNIAAATSALVMFNFGYEPISTFTYTINGHAHTASSPFPPGAAAWRSVALPVPLTDLVPGTQNVRLSGNQSMLVTNVNIVLIAAATVP